MSEVLVASDATFPVLERGTPHTICTTRGREGYPPRKLTGPVPWSEANPDYHPPAFTHPRVLQGPDWADPAERVARPYPSYEAEGDVLRNPRGRTGLAGRGILGKWGANFAADPVVTRVHGGKLEMAAIERVDAGTWAIPGGMADFGESVAGTLARELAEEALGKQADAAAVRALEDKFRHLFATDGREVYAGYVDDPRNTDEAWMETKAVHLHLTGDDAQIELIAGDDASQARWMEVSRENVAHLYASHGPIVLKAVRDWQAASGCRVLGDGTVLPIREEAYAPFGGLSKIQAAEAGRPGCADGPLFTSA